MLYRPNGANQPEGGSYAEAFSRKRRGLLVFLLDQSGSMAEKVAWQGYDITLAQMAAAILNSLLNTMIEKALPDLSTGRRKNSCDFIIFGYGDKVTSLLNTNAAPVSLPDLAEHPLDHHKVRVTTRNANTGAIDTREELQPYWVEPLADSSWTDMTLAISAAHQAVQNWLNADTSRVRSFPPIVINITDGRHGSPNGGNPIQEATKLRQLRTEDGSVLLFNCHITKSITKSLSFPSNTQQLKNAGLSLDEQAGAGQLLEMSSVLPASMAQIARQVFNKIIPQGAHGFMYNADGQDLINFLLIGTRQTPG